MHKCWEARMGIGRSAVAGLATSWGYTLVSGDTLGFESNFVFSWEGLLS